jgi:hypothetical protein
MRNTRSFLASCLLLGAVALLAGCAGTPPPPPSTPAEPPGTGEPAPPAAPPPPEPSAPTTAAGYSGPEPCKLALKGNSPVARACLEGGARAAKLEMKDLVKRAKDNGARFRCDDCHKDPGDITRLAADVGEKFKKLLTAAK